MWGIFTCRWKTEQFACMMPVFPASGTRHQADQCHDKHCREICLVTSRFAAVYDGHEGSHAASTAAALLHFELLQQLLPCNMAQLERYTTMSAMRRLAQPRMHCASFSHRLQSLAQHLMPGKSALETAVHTSIQNVDDTVLKSSEQQQTGSGTTAVFALAFHHQILVSHLGDSKAVLCQHVQQGSALNEADKLNLRAVLLTIDHSPDRPDERARIVAAGGTISTATSGEQPTHPDCRAAPCSSVHAGMLCCAVLCCAVLCCAVLCCAVLCCAL